jgi:UDPglucose--hexose-1-phosphate uridylyltransferase
MLAGRFRLPKIAFERFESRFTILNPFNNFAREEHVVEVRKDPLLGDTSIYNPYLKDQAKAFFGQNDEELIRKLAEDPAGSCIFCGENARKKTARYPDELLPGGRMEQGEAVLFANLFSLAAHHPVIVLSKAHFLRPSEMTPPLLADGFQAARTFLNDIYRQDAALAFATVNCNYLLPAGASLVHPHMQMLVTPVPYSYQARLLSGMKDYLAKCGTPYLSDLLEEEMRGGERYIARRGAWHWLASYSPIGNNDIMAIHDAEGDLGRISVPDLRDLCEGISRVLSLLERRGSLSFNFTLSSARGGETVGFRSVFRIVTRQNLYANYRNDDYFLQKMLQSELILTLPEDLAKAAREVL